MAIITFADIHGVEQTLDTGRKFNVAYNADCMDFLRACPDGCFDLAVVDPPYGDGSSQSSSREVGNHLRFHGGDRWDRYINAPESGSNGRDLGGEVRKKIVAWDVAPGKEYFNELFRVSRNAVVWGGNYFDLPPTRCFLVWRKLSISEQFSMAMAEYAWTNFDANAKVFECAPQGKPGDPRFHPTAKPIDLYRWIFGLFSKPGMTILDTHLGSGSSRIAAQESGLNFVGTEIDERYFGLEEERFERMTQNYSLFD